MPTATPLNERMKALRIALELTQESLAERGADVGLDRIQVNHVESGRNKMNSKIICSRYAKALWLTEDELNKFIKSDQDPVDVAKKITKRGPPPWTSLDQPAELGTWGAHPMWDEATSEAKIKYKRIVTDEVVDELAQFRGAAQIPQRLTAEWIYYQAQAHLEAKEADGK
jgi:transcriptional regulator with XRE-family HTH domain